ASTLLLLPTVLQTQVESTQKNEFSNMQDQFPVTVNPQDKTIVENGQVDSYLGGPGSPLQAAAGNVENVFERVFDWIAIAVADSSWYQSLASSDGRFVSVTPG